jgi:hypothetical protein
MWEEGRPYLSDWTRRAQRQYRQGTFLGSYAHL